MRHFFLFIVVLCLGFPLRPAHAEVEERIKEFAADVQVQANGTVNVTERLTYDFYDNERHGIFRTIPMRYRARGGTYALRFSHVTVTDETGSLIPFQQSTPGNDLQIKIGDPEMWVTGRQTYVLSYTVARAINFFDDHDEFYWNVTGNEWQIPMDQVNSTLALPSSASTLNVKAECFVGELGSTTRCDEISITDKTVKFSSANLLAVEGLTIVVSLPKGVVTQPTREEQLFATLRDNNILLFPIVVLVFFVGLWWKRGRDPKGRGTIIPEYEAPDGLTPAEVGTIVDEHVSRRDLSAMIIHFAVCGVLDITRIPKKLQRDDYRFKKMKSAETLRNDFERIFIEKMFGSKTEVRLSDLKNKFAQDLQTIEKEIYKAMQAKQYFIRNPQSVRVIYMILGGVVAGGLTPLVGGRGGLWIASVLIAGVIIFIFGFLMPARTAKGVKAKEHILGLKQYLTVAEKDRLNFHHAPKKDPKHFEALLPYAMVLGVEKAWAKQFEGLFTSPPRWYHDSTSHAFSAIYFASALSDFEHRAGSVLASRASSAAGGGSGFGGGGFSGGGFGGGGGGSW